MTQHLKHSQKEYGESLMYIGMDNNQYIQEVCKKITSLEKRVGEKILIQILTTGENTKYTDIKIVDKGDKNQVTVDSIKEAVSFLKEPPTALSKKYLVFKQAQDISPKAQNILLKTLEEPPLFAIILLSVNKETGVLETISSRCKKFFYNTGVKPINEDKRYSLNKFWPKYWDKPSEIGECLKIAEELAKEDKDTILEVINGWLAEIHDYIQNHTKSNADSKSLLLIPPFAEAVEEVATTIKNGNSNIRLSLEYLVLK